MANVMSQRIERAASDSTLLELDKAGVILGFLVGLIAMLAYQHGVEEPSMALGAALVAASTWLGLKGAQVLTRLLR